MGFTARDVKDRVVQYPHRYDFVPVDGFPNRYDLVPVPGTVTEAGTAINKAYLQPIENVLQELDSYNVVSITNSGNWVVPDNVNEIEVFLVGGGGAGGGHWHYKGGGGGSGGECITFKAKVTQFQNIPIVIGSGGAYGAIDTVGSSGGNSSFGSITAKGGGAAPFVASNSNGNPGVLNSSSAETTNSIRLGCSGGVAKIANNTVVTQADGGMLEIIGVGTRSNYCPFNDTWYAGGGGGGGAGCSTSGNVGGLGGIGAHGGGNGSNGADYNLYATTHGYNAAANTGSGGGGAGGHGNNFGSTLHGGSGGSGICIIKY